MIQRILLFFICGFFLVSCDFFQKKELSNDVVIDTVIDFNSVDIFPLFPKCDSIPSQEKQKICSQIKLSQHIYASLVSVKITTSKKVSDTLLVTLNIDKAGKVSLSNIKSSEFIQHQIPNLDSLIKVGIENLPTLKPAIKRGMPVATEFTLPIVVRN
ncbi:MAG: hypothetical protein COB73_05285 [Flavobacteriaceae bacterium]|nr:MAG: hypothetical protein COB73_05285 [Flavobacteriaceae bacterium]